MDKNTKENGKLIRETDKELILLLRVINTKENGKMGRETDGELLLRLMEKSRKVYG
jgi:hypothetical protein